MSVRLPAGLVQLKGLLTSFNHLPPQKIDNLIQSIAKKWREGIRKTQEHFSKKTTDIAASVIYPKGERKEAFIVLPGQMLGKGTTKIVWPAVLVTPEKVIEMACVEVPRNTSTLKKKLTLAEERTLEKIQSSSVEPQALLTHVFGSDRKEDHLENKTIRLFRPRCNGDLLKLRKEMKKPFRWQLLVFAVDILKGIAAVNAKGLDHNDVKLENFFFYVNKDETACYKIRAGDLGFADPELTRGKFTGSPLYMSPEKSSNQYQKLAPGTVDAWSLGIVLFQILHPDHDQEAFQTKNMVQLAPPFIRRAFAHIRFQSQFSQKIITTSQASIDYDLFLNWLAKNPLEKAFQTVIKGLLRKDPRQRWTAQQALEVLAKLLPLQKKPPTPTLDSIRRSITKNLIEVILYQAEYWRRSAHFSKALACLDRVFKIDPNHAQAWLLKAEIHRVCLEHSEFLSSYNKIQHHSSKPAVARTCGAAFREISLRWRKKRDKKNAQTTFKIAEEHLTCAIQLGENDAFTLFHRGALYLATDQTEKAAQDLKQAFALNKNDPFGCLYLAKLELRKFPLDLKQCDVYLSTAIKGYSTLGKQQKLTPLMRDNFHSVFTQAYLFGMTCGRQSVYQLSNRKEGDQLTYQLAIKYLSLAIEKKIMSPHPLFLRGALYLEQGQTKKAAQDLHQAIALKPEDPFGCLYYAKLKLSEGEEVETVMLYVDKSIKGYERLKSANRLSSFGKYCHNKAIEAKIRLEVKGNGSSRGSICTFQ